MLIGTMRFDFLCVPLRPPRFMRFFVFLGVLASLAVMLYGVEARAEGAPEIYQQHCASCHGADRLGAMGPALLPENLERLKRPAAEEVDRAGPPRHPDARVR